MAASRQRNERAVSLLLESGNPNFADAGWPKALVACYSAAFWSANKLLMVLHLIVPVVFCHSAMNKQFVERIIPLQTMFGLWFVFAYDQTEHVNFFVLAVGHIFGWTLSEICTLPMWALIFACVLAYPTRITRLLLFRTLTSRGLRARVARRRPGTSIYNMP